MFDCIIIGAGPAGMTAALNLLRDNKKVLILEKANFGGQIANAPRVENIPSIKEISGLDFSSNLFDQILALGVEFDLDEIKSIKKENDIFVLQGNYTTYESQSVLVATGVKHRPMGLSNEEKLIGKGVSYCAVCDGAFYDGKDVCIIGDANTALQYTFSLSNIAKKVYLYTLFDKFFADKILVDRLKDKDNVIIKHNLLLKELKEENDTLKSLLFEDTTTSKLEELYVDGVFIAIGQIPSNEIFNELVTLNKGFIVTDERMNTKTKGLFAAGDCRDKDYRQVVTAQADGSIAAIEIS